MKKALIYLVLPVSLIFIVSYLASANTIIKGALPDKLPPREKCAECHDITHIFKELTESSHKELNCFDCHVPGRVQAIKHEEKDLSFYKLGYHEKEGNWIEVSGNEVCLRCHGEDTKKNITEKCWSCHMIQDGVDKVVIVKDKKKPISTDNIKEVKKYPHKSHLFKNH